MTTPILVRLSSVLPERVTWLWDGRLPLGKLVVLDGDPSLGKSTLCLDFGARVSTGTPWPDGRPCRRGHVLLMTAEDGIADTVRPRLDAAGGDPEHVHILTACTYTDEDGIERRRAFTLADIEALEQAVRDSGACLVVIDVLMAFLPTGIDSHRDQDVRTVLARLADLASRLGCCIVLLRHLSKTGGANPLYRGGGSIGIVGAARAAFLVAQDPDDQTRRIFAATKSNLAAEPPSLAYRLVEDPTNGCARVAWEAEPVDITAHQLLAPRLTDDERTDRDAVAEWLRDLLGDGPMPAADVYKHADAAGFSKDQVKRAKPRAGVHSTHPDIRGPWFWELTREHQGSQESEHAEPAPFAPLVLPRACCSVCGDPLHPALAADGETTTHPTCREDNDG